MPHYNSVFHDLLKRIPWSRFDELVDQHQADKHVRSLTTKSQLVAMLYAQFSGARSLREIVDGLQSHSARLYHAGAKPLARTTLSDANRLRSAAIFTGLFAELVKCSRRGLRRKMGERVFLIDATGLRLSALSTDWAHFSSGVCGAKAHVIYDAEAEAPTYLSLTPSRVNDITAAHKMPVEAGATYVFDLGYYDYAWWARLDGQGCRIVTRFKKNTALKVIVELDLPEDSDLLSDRIGLLPARRAGSRKNPFSKPVREVRARTDTGKILRILSNDLDASAQEIADLYKRRWAIELFFKWVKQTLKIKHFLGQSENAVRIQVAVALIAYLVLQMAQATQDAVKSLLAFARLVRANLMHRKPIDRLLEPEPIRMNNPNQLVIIWQ